MTEEILYFVLCPHVKERELPKWKSIALKISQILKKEIELVTCSNFSELCNIKPDYHFYYANPDSALKLMEMGYHVLGKLKTQNEKICSIQSKSFNPEKNKIRVALINQKYFFLPLLMYTREYKKFQLTFVNSFEEVLRLIKEDRVDIGFVYTQNLEELKENNEIKVSSDFCFPILHLILIHPSMEKFKDELLLIEEIEKVSSLEIDNLKALYNQLDKMLAEWAYHDISEAITTSPNMGIIVYQEKIVFFNEYARNLLGYSEEELYNMNSIDIVYPDDRKMLIESKERRLKGEKFSKIYEIRFQKKDGSIVYVECLTNTILFRGVYSGFIVFYDTTSSKYSENIKEILKEINKIITKSMTEEEIYKGICDALVQKLGLKLAWIGHLDEKNNKIIPAFYSGDDKGFFQIYDYNIFPDTLSGDALLKGEIAINSDSRQYAKNQQCALELIKREFMSSCTIPIFKYGKVVSLLKIYSEFPNYFNETVIDILKEIQQDMSFALERVDMIRHNMIISEALKNSDTWILVTDEKGNILYINEAVEKISGYKKEELIGKNPRIFKSGLNPPEFYKEMWDTILSGRIFNAITPNRKKNGEIFHVDLKIIPVRLPGNVLRFVAVAKDVTEKIKLSERIQRLQNYDALTGLLNMNGFALNVSQRIKETSGLGLLILIDIYEMTHINKAYGINTGDQLLIKFAERIKESFENTDTIARISADTFGVYMALESSSEIYSAYSKLYELNNSVFKINDKTVSININAALSVFPKDGKSFKSLYERADIALQQAKKAGAGVILFFDSEIEREAEKLWEVFALLKKAIEDKLFTFYYQPYFYTESLKFAGAEALVRIIDRNGKLYTPDFFIDHLENSHYLRSFENWAIGEIVDKINRWKINISLNISAKTFSNPIILSILSAVPSDVREKLTVEITERTFVKEPEYAMNILREIKSMDNPPKIAIDDFGTGYSSMIYLRDLPVDIIKIDKIFIKDMVKDKKSLAIVQTIIDLARRLEKKTLAEGVETEEQLEILKSAGCDLVQGFLFSKPVPEKEIVSFIA